MSAFAMIFVALWKKLFNYPHKISSPLLKCLRRKKEYYSRLNDFCNVKLISSNIQAEIDRLNSIFTSRLSNCKPSQLWSNIRSLGLVPTKRNISNINVDALIKSFIYGHTDTPVLLPPLLLNPSAFKPASNSDILPLLSRIKSNSTEISLIIPPLVLKKVCKRALFLRH